MAVKRQYTEAEKAAALAALAANGGNAAQTARDTGIPKTTIQAWNRGAGLSADVNPSAKKRDMADECERIAWKLLHSIENASAIKAAPLGQRSTAFGTIVDKMRLLRGQSTENIDIIESAAREADIKFAAISARSGSAGVLGEPDGDPEG